MDHLGWQVGNGMHISLWNDQIPLADLVSENEGVMKLAKQMEAKGFNKINDILWWDLNG